MCRCCRWTRWSAGRAALVDAYLLAGEQAADPDHVAALAASEQRARRMRDHGEVPITIAELATDPSAVTRRLIVAGTPLTLRALLPGDTVAMAAFLAGLSATSRRFWHGDVDAAEQAAEWVEAIGRYDKLRLVVHQPDRPDRFDGMVDLSFCVPDFAELSRYAGYGFALDPDRTVRFGPCVADARQGGGLAAALLAPTWDAVRLLGCDRVVLYGGVHAENVRGQRFYRRHGFVEVGTFDDGANIDMVLDIAELADA